MSVKGKRKMVRTKEFINWTYPSWTHPDGHLVGIGEQINAYIREHDISAENLIDVKYTAYVKTNDEVVTQALLIYKN